ncbi:MAG: thiamine pyrophosphokinase [Paracoccaceae bacterium]|jgi:thiamine pyrophosphokinase
MSDYIIHNLDPIALIGGGELGARDLGLVMDRVTMLVAADGGAAAALQAEIIPDAVIGDFDSLSASDAAQIPQNRLHRVSEQDSTDFDKALRAIDSPLILAIGFLGARVDHQLAAFNTLVRHPDRPCILIGPHEVIVHAPPRLELALSAGAVVSLFPLAPVTGRSAGLEWAIDGLAFAPDSRIGTSNRATGPISLDMDGPGMLLIVPRAALDMVIRGLIPRDRSGARAPLPVRWPARA